MLYKVMAIMGVISDIITIVSMLFVTDATPVWVKWIIILVATIIAIIMVILAHEASDIKVRKYHYKKDVNEYRVYTQKNKFLLADSLVSIYYRYEKEEEKYDELVAYGYVFENAKASDVEIKIFKILDDSKLENIRETNRSVKKFHVKPNVEFSRFSHIFDEKEVANNV